MAIPALLAQDDQQAPVPLKLSANQPKAHDAMKDKVASILSYALKLRDGPSRSQWRILWEECAQYFHPNRLGFTSTHVPGDDRHLNVTGSIAELARRSLSTAMSTMLRPAGKQWFKCRTRNETLMGDESVRAWCDIATRLTYSALYDPRAGFEKQCSECDADIVTFGTGVLQIGWEKSKRHLKFKTHSLANVVLALNDLGVYDQAFVFWKLTLRQIVAMFGEENLPAHLKDELTNGDPQLDKEHEVLHACLPNGDFKAFGLGAQRLPYASFWVDVTSKEMLNASGYYEFPYVCSPWDTTTGEIYGRSPAMTALRDARLASTVTRTLVDAAEKALNPPLVGYADAIRGNLELFAGGMTMIDTTGLPQGANDPIKPIQLGAQPNQMLDFLKMIEDRIGAAFFRDILELPSPKADSITATEINARQDQYLRQAAPIFSRLEANYNAGIMNRVFAILLREGVFPDPPKALYGQDITFEYDSPIKTARDQSEAMKIVQGIQTIAGFAQMNPAVLDNIDFDVTARYVGQRADLPQLIFTPLDQMMQAREAKAKEAQQAKMAQLAQTAGPGVAALMGGMAKAKQAGMLDQRNPAVPSPADPGQADPSQQTGLPPVAPGTMQELSTMFGA